MANEASIRDRLENPMDFTVANTTAIEKGALLALTDPRTAIAPSSQGQSIAGIAAREKIASDGRTQLAVFRRGIFDMHCSGAITIGGPVVAEGGDFPNSVLTALGENASGADIIGHALETCSDGETAQIYVNVGGGTGPELV